VEQLAAAPGAGHKAIDVMTVDLIVVNLHRTAAAPAPRRLSAVIPDYEVVDAVVPNNESCAVETVCERSLKCRSSASECVVLDKQKL
jgi:hypothetical protein